MVTLRATGSDYIYQVDNNDQAHPWIEDSIQAAGRISSWLRSRLRFQLMGGDDGRRFVVVGGVQSRC